MIEKTCCVTGHRDIPANKMKDVKSRLQAELESAIEDGYTVILSGFAQGVDLLFAGLVIAQKSRRPGLSLVAAIPYRGRLNTKDQVFHRCLSACDQVHIQRESYSGGCFISRNRWMVTLSSRVIAVYDGRKRGGTAFTMGYAHKLGKNVREIRI